MKNTLIKTNKKYLPGLLNIAVPIMLSNLISQLQMLIDRIFLRSEERRVGKECRSRW